MHEKKTEHCDAETTFPIPMRVYQTQPLMEVELDLACRRSDETQRSRASRADYKRSMLWFAAHALRDADVPHVSDEDVARFVKMAYLSTLPSYVNITLAAYSLMLKSLPPDERTWFTRIVKLAHHLEKETVTATDADWEAWMDTL